MAFTKCWLAYPEIRGCRCDAISLHTELTGETIDRAKQNWPRASRPVRRSADRGR